MRRGGVAGVVAGVGLLMASAHAQSERPRAVIETPKGRIVIELYAAEAPKTVANFVKLVKEGFYNGIIFHRVIPGFMVQTGDPTGTGMGGPGYTFEDEFAPGLRHDGPGVVSMANAGPHTNGSQFFITLAAAPWLDGKHAIFGRVVEGQPVIEQIVAVERNAQDRPLTDIPMTRVTIEEPSVPSGS
ncbi:MAG: peptidylprolyl isomerase [Candidatus Omnitrophica bacterium]|nr:peptidylprolyl isomerase [Candidatus Omnitrophota bacterium]